MKTAKWQKPSRVYVETIEAMPSARMGSSLVNYGDKLYVYGGADPYHEEGGKIFSDFFSFNMSSGLWKKENDFTELKSSDGVMMGAALRMYNYDAVIFSGGCNTQTNKCGFGVTKSILFEQPNAHFTDGIVDVDEFNGRMGHSLV